MLPITVSKELAYLIGVLAGDGNIQIRENKKTYRIKCVGNPKDEVEFYNSIIKPIFKRIFNLDITVKKHDSNTTYGFEIYSKSMVQFLTEIFELPKGKKYNKLKIPNIIKETRNVTSFIRGVADTDFCISYKKNGTYPCIACSSNSKEFMKEIASELKKLGFKLYEAYDYKLIDSRCKKGYSLINRVELNGKKNLDLWMQNIGFSSPKHLMKVKKNSGEWNSRGTRVLSMIHF